MTSSPSLNFQLQRFIQIPTKQKIGHPKIAMKDDEMRHISLYGVYEGRGMVKSSGYVTDPISESASSGPSGPGVIRFRGSLHEVNAKVIVVVVVANSSIFM